MIRPAVEACADGVTTTGQFLFAVAETVTERGLFCTAMLDVAMV